MGAERARDGVPLSSVMDVYRVGFRRLWEAVAEELATREHTNGDALYRLTAKLLTAQDIFTGAMAVRYREEQTRRLLADGWKPSDLVGSRDIAELCLAFEVQRRLM